MAPADPAAPGDASTVLLSLSLCSLRLQASSAPSEHDLEFVGDDLTSNECRVVNMRSASLCLARRIQNCGVSSHSVAGNVLRTARLKQDTYSNAAFEA